MMRAMRKSVEKTKRRQSTWRRLFGILAGTFFALVIVALIAIQGIRLFAPSTFFKESVQRFEVAEIGTQGARVEILGKELWLEPDEETPLAVGEGVFVTYRYRGPTEDREVVVESWKREEPDDLEAP